MFGAHKPLPLGMSSPLLDVGLRNRSDLRAGRGCVADVRKTRTRLGDVESRWAPIHPIYSKGGWMDGRSGLKALAIQNPYVSCHDSPSAKHNNTNAFISNINNDEDTNAIINNDNSVIIAIINNEVNANALWPLSIMAIILTLLSIMIIAFYSHYQ